MPSIDRPDPPFLQVVRHYREEILSGRLAEGDLLPAVRTIAKLWNIAHATAAKVVNTLKAEGLVAGKQGVGTVVTGQNRHRSAQDRLTAVHRTGLIYPEGHYAQIRSAELTDAPGYVAQALNLEPGVPVIRRQRTTYSAEDFPQATSISWFDGELTESCPKLLIPERIKKGTINYIAEVTGRTLRNGRDGVAAASATEDVATELQVDPGSPVLLGRNWWQDESGWVAEFGESISPEGRWVYYDYEIASNG